MQKSFDPKVIFAVITNDGKAINCNPLIFSLDTNHPSQVNKAFDDSYRQLVDHATREENGEALQGDNTTKLSRPAATANIIDQHPKLMDMAIEIGKKYKEFLRNEETFPPPLGADNYQETISKRADFVQSLLETYRTDEKYADMFDNKGNIAICDVAEMHQKAAPTITGHQAMWGTEQERTAAKAAEILNNKKHGFLMAGHTGPSR